MARTGEQETVWELKPHTAAKHELLTNYLAAWFPILSRWNGRIVFLDGFAGPGVYKGDKPGSPVKALDVLLTHTFGARMADKQFVFLFNEADQERYDTLTRVIDDYRAAHQPWPQNVTVEVGCDSFENVAEGILSYLDEQKAHLAPTFAFVDPFSAKGIPMDLLRRLLSFKKCELFVYFHFDFVNRWATAGNVDALLTELYGTDEYKQVHGRHGDERKAFLHDLYQRQLEQVCGFKYVKSFEMIRDDNKTGYFLFFCTRDIAGLRVIKDAMWKVDPTGGARFSDVLAGQDVLFGDDLDIAPVQDALAQHFRGQTVDIGVVEEFILAKTPLASGHMKKQVLKPMQVAGKISSPNQRRKNTYPDGTLVTFVE